MQIADKTNQSIDHLDETIQAYRKSHHSNAKRNPASIWKHNEVEVFMKQCLQFAMLRDWILPSKTGCMNLFIKIKPTGPVAIQKK